jgi:hypothetical protein
MKRYIIIFVTLFCIIYFQNIKIYAQTTGPTPTPVAYALAYPGLLPDSPLYFFKAIRDRIEAFFISSPDALSSFDMQESDKRVESAYLLVSTENKVPLAESTFSKGENYFSDAINKAQQAKTQGMNIKDLSSQLFLSNQKHIEILHNIEQIIPKRDSTSFYQDEIRLLQFQKEVIKLQPIK